MIVEYRLLFILGGLLLITGCSLEGYGTVNNSIAMFKYPGYIISSNLTDNGTALLYNGVVLGSSSSSSSSSNSSNYWNITSDNKTIYTYKNVSLYNSFRLGNSSYVSRPYFSYDNATNSLDFNNKVAYVDDVINGSGYASYDGSYFISCTDEWLIDVYAIKSINGVEYRSLNPETISASDSGGNCDFGSPDSNLHFSWDAVEGADYYLAFTHENEFFEDCFDMGHYFNIDADGGNVHSLDLTDCSNAIGGDFDSIIAAYSIKTTLRKNNSINIDIGNNTINLIGNINQKTDENNNPSIAHFQYLYADRIISYGDMTIGSIALNSVYYGIGKDWHTSLTDSRGTPSHETTWRLWFDNSYGLSDARSTALDVHYGDFGQGNIQNGKELFQTYNQLVQWGWVPSSLTNFNPIWGYNTTVGKLEVYNSGSAGHVTCWKTDNTLGYCSSIVGVTGTCTCN